MPENKVPSYETEKVKRVFRGNQGIGGGCGLPSLIPYFNKDGFYPRDKVKDDHRGNYEF